MISFPPCKINLGLHVLAKRSDGYHDIETCFYPIPWTDVLEIIPSSELQFSSSGIAIPGNANENLCLKSYHLLKEVFNLAPVKIYLHKILPIGAGLGGGSSNAAHTLRLLNEIFKLNLTADQLRAYAAKLGSDCSYFIEDKPMIGTGRGEILKEVALSLAGKFVVLINPSIHVSTAEAYSGVSFTSSKRTIRDILTENVSVWKADLTNDFENSIFKKHPIIQSLKEELYKHGAVYAAMSGSGSTVFGIFDQPVDLKNQFTQFMYWSGELN